MYIRRLHVDHLKRLRDFKLDFTDKHGKPRMWTVLIGENGTAKTTILQAIALAAAGSQADAIAAPVAAHLRDRRTSNPLKIDATFAFTPQSNNALIHPYAPSGTSKGLALYSEVWMQSTTSTKLRAKAMYVDSKTGAPVQSKDGADPLDMARDLQTPLWFVVGYGISRLLPPDSTSTPALTRPSIERMEPLFKPTAAMTSTSFANHFLKKDLDEGRKAGTTSLLFARMLKQALDLGGAELLPNIQKLELRGQGGAPRSSDLLETDRFHQRMGKDVVKIAGVALSHGYQSTFAWIADLIGHVLLESKTKLDTTEMEGLVLIDEIDAYLHPRWQATLIAALRRIFPKMQFVATTHSPVVLASVAPHEIVRLDINEDTGNVEEKRWLSADGTEELPGPDPRPMSGGELYRIWFDVDRLTPNPHGEALRRYLVLAGDPFRSPEDNKELARLEKELANAKLDPGAKPVRQRKSR
jgi:AAA domain, putative AbiEii toxin, Type IV TA system/AAA ATPase domain